ncbi:MAG: hypothetical protein RL591_2541, partial [Planctomycetota bacterium]
GAALGAAFGAALGVAFGAALGAAFGAALGVVLGATLGAPFGTAGDIGARGVTPAGELGMRGEPSFCAADSVVARQSVVAIASIARTPEPARSVCVSERSSPIPQRGLGAESMGAESDSDSGFDAGRMEYLAMTSSVGSVEMVGRPTRAAPSSRWRIVARLKEATRSVPYSDKFTENPRPNPFRSWVGPHDRSDFGNVHRI